MRDTIEFGDTLTCAETGKQFIAARDGCTTNYARTNSGEVLSDEGVDIRERRELLDRSRPFVCYVSSDGKSVTGWKANKLGDAYKVGTVRLTRRSWVHGPTMNAYRVTDVHGGEWHGRGSPGIAIVLRPCAEPRTAVVFRVWKDNGEVIALFPYLDAGRGYCMSYVHNGQHGDADYRACIAQTRPAKPEEFATLKRELEGPIGYRLRVIQRRGR